MILVNAYTIKCKTDTGLCNIALFELLYEASKSSDCGVCVSEYFDDDINKQDLQPKTDTHIMF